MECLMHIINWIMVCGIFGEELNHPVVVQALDLNLQLGYRGVEHLTSMFLFLFQIVIGFSWIDFIFGMQKVLNLIFN